MAYGDKSGIGGWLLLFLITYAAGMLISLAGTLYQLFVFGIGSAGFPGQTVYRATLCSVLAAQTAAVVTVFWRLIAVRTWRTVRLAVVILWVSPFAGRLIALIAAMRLLELTALPRPGMTIAYFLAQAAYSGLWTAYFLRSKRIANTFRRRSKDDLAATFA